MSKYAALTETAAARVVDIDQFMFEEPDGAPRRLERVDPGPVWRGERVKPSAAILTRTDGVSVFPPGINYLFGDSGDGKSWVMAWAAVQQLRGGRSVVWASWEDPEGEEIIGRLKVLGLELWELDALHIFTPAEGLTEITDELAHYCRSHAAALLVIDSVGEVGALEGVNEDKDAEWGPWARHTIRRLYDTVTADIVDPDGNPGVLDFAVVPIDHTTKSKENPHFPSGTKRKRAFVRGLMVGVQVREPFGKGSVGRVNLIASKDSTGRFRRGEVCAEVVLDSTHPTVTVSVYPPAAGTELTTGKKRTAQDRILEVLGDANGDLTAEEVRRIANSDTHRMPGEVELAAKTVQNALTKLTNVTRTKKPTGIGQGYQVTYAAEVLD